MSAWRWIRRAPLPVHVLERWAHTPYGVLGRWGQWHTLENQWKDNQQNVSCIPAGEYTCVRRWFNKGGYESFELLDVPGRSLILPHIGNTDADTRGCPLIGSYVGVLHGRLAVKASRAAFEELMQSLEGVAQFRLIVKWRRPEDQERYV